MKNVILMTMMLIAASFLLISCGGPAASNASNAGNKLANSTATAPAADAAAIETEIKKLANDGVAAITKGDTAALDKMWADNYVWVDPDGAVLTKAQRIENFKSGQTKIESLSYDEMSVRSNPEGTGAILIGRATVKGTQMGKPIDRQVRFTQVWSKTKDGWRSVSGQVTPIAAAAKTDDKKTDDDKKADVDKKEVAPAGNANK